MARLPGFAPGCRARSIPAKTFEYMASRRPILAAVPEGDARDFLQCCGTGLVCRPDDVAAMADVLGRLYAAWRRGASIVEPRPEYIRRFEIGELAGALAAVFDDVLDLGSASAEVTLERTNAC